MSAACGAKGEGAGAGVGRAGGGGGAGAGGCFGRGWVVVCGPLGRGGAAGALSEDLSGSLAGYVVSGWKSW